MLIIIHLLNGVTHSRQTRLALSTTIKRMKQDDEFKEAIKEMIDEILPLIVNEVE